MPFEGLFAFLYKSQESRYGPLRRAGEITVFYNGRKAITVKFAAFQYKGNNPP
jgi:hypothetical protein